MIYKNRCLEHLPPGREAGSYWKENNSLETCVEHMLCFNLSGGYQGVHIFQHRTSHFRLVRFMHLTEYAHI